jgi:hypothetical protein
VDPQPIVVAFDVREQITLRGLAIGMIALGTSSVFRVRLWPREALAEQDGELRLGHGPLARQIHSCSEQFKTRKRSLVAASLLGDGPRP